MIFNFRIDDSQLDERAMRDTRMIAEYRVSVCGHVEEGLRSLKRTSSSFVSDPLNEFIDRIVAQVVFCKALAFYESFVYSF